MAVRKHRGSDRIGRCSQWHGFKEELTEGPLKGQFVWVHYRCARRGWHTVHETKDGRTWQRKDQRKEER